MNTLYAVAAVTALALAGWVVEAAAPYAVLILGGAVLAVAGWAALLAHREDTRQARRDVEFARRNRTAR